LLVGLEMDEDRMSLHWFHGLLSWVLLPVLAAHLLGGIGLGVLYFRGLRWNTRQFVDGARIAAVVALMFGRFALLAAVLWAVSLEGAMPLLAAALGLFIARGLAIRGARRTGPLAVPTP
jgi:F1F0 ATPase subunit 2